MLKDGNNKTDDNIEKIGYKTTRKMEHGTAQPRAMYSNQKNTRKQESSSMDTFMIFGPQDGDQKLYDSNVEEEATRTLDFRETFPEVLVNSNVNYDVELKPNFCYHCGNELQNQSEVDKINYCPKCGASQFRKISSGTSLENPFSKRSSVFSISSDRESFTNTPPFRSGLTSAPSEGEFSYGSPSKRGSFADTPYERKSTSPQTRSFSNTPEVHTNQTGLKNNFVSSHGEPIESSDSNTDQQMDNPILIPSFKVEESLMNFLSKEIDQPLGFKDRDPMFSMNLQTDVKMEDLSALDIETFLNEIHPHSQLRTGISTGQESSTEVTVETDEFGDTKLHLFIQKHRNEEAIQELRRLKSQFNDETFRNYLNKRNDRGLVPLHDAVRHVDILDNLLQYGADVTLLDHSGNNILHQIVFASSSEKDVLKLFNVVFKHQAMYEKELEALLNDIEKAYNSEGFAVVHELARRSFGETLKFIKKKGANLNITSRKEKQTPLVLAAKERNWNIVKTLCSLGACVNIPTSSDWYAVHAAIEDCDTVMLEFFMKKGVDIYGFKQIESTNEIYQLCMKYMRRRRRQTATSDRGNKKRRRCSCGSNHSNHNE